MSDFWRLGPSRNSWDGLGQTYCVAREIFGRAYPAAERATFLGATTKGQFLALISAILRDQDLSGSPGSEVDAKWVNAALGGLERSRFLSELARGRRALPPQLLLMAANEVLLHSPDGLPSTGLEGLTELVKVALGIAEEITAPRTGEVWGGLDIGLAGEVFANYYLNHAINPIDLMSTVGVMWRQGWSVRADPKLLRILGRTPAELYSDSTGVQLDDFIGVGVHLWVQADQHEYVRFPPDFFSEIGIPKDAIDLFLSQTRRTVSELVAARSNRAPRWNFDEFRRFPLVLLDDGTTLVMRIGFVLQRVMGAALRWDVLNELGDEDVRNPVRPTRQEAFRDCLSTSFEDHVGAVLKRIFPGNGPFERVYSESRMQSAWRPKKGPEPKVCDWVVDCGRTWLCMEVIDRVVPRTLVNGDPTTAQLDDELGKVVTRRKAKQLTSTEDQLRGNMSRLCGRSAHPQTSYIRIIVTPNEGLPWNPAVDRRLEEIRRDGSDLPNRQIAIMTVRELLMLEAASEDGESVENLLTRWWTANRSRPLDQVLAQEGVRLHPPRWQSEASEALLDHIASRMDGHGGTSAIEPTPDR